MLSFTPILLGLTVLAQLSFVAQADSILFSQYIGAETASATFSGDSASFQSQYFTICTNFLHGIVDPSYSGAPSTYVAYAQQVQVDHVCQFCTSVSQTRIDSCCGAATSVDCFAKYAAGKTGAAATATAGSSSPSTTGNGATAATSTSRSGGGAVGANKDIIAGSFMAAMVGLVAWAL